MFTQPKPGSARNKNFLYTSGIMRNHWTEQKLQFEENCINCLKKILTSIPTCLFYPQWALTLCRLHHDLHAQGSPAQLILVIMGQMFGVAVVLNMLGSLSIPQQPWRHGLLERQTFRQAVLLCLVTKTQQVLTCAPFQRKEHKTLMKKHGTHIKGILMCSIGWVF